MAIQFSETILNTIDGEKVYNFTDGAQTLQDVTNLGNTTTNEIILKNSGGSKQFSLKVDENGNLLLSGGTDQNLHVSGDVVAFSDMTPPTSSWFSSIPLGYGLAYSGGTIVVTGGTSPGGGITINNPGNNRLLTSNTGTTSIDAESNLTFNNYLNIKGNTELLRLESTSSVGNCYMNFYSSTGHTGQIGYTSDNNLSLWNNKNADIQFATNNSVRLKIKSDGSITNDNAQSRQLQFSRLTIGRSGTGFATIGENYNVTTTNNQYRYAENGVATQIDFTSGNIKLRTAVSGTSNNVISFVDRLTVIPAGAVEINSDNGQALKITTDYNTGHCYIRLSNKSHDLGYVGFGSATNENMQIQNQRAGNITFATNNSTRVTITDSALTASGEVQAFSDRRLKENIVDYKRGLEVVKQIRPVFYNLKNSPDRTTIGVIAQELLEVEPILVEQTGEYLSVNYQKMNMFLINAVKELSERVEQLESELKLKSNIKRKKNS